MQGPFAKTFAFYEGIQIGRPASTGKSCNTFGGLPPIRDLRWMKSEYEYDIRAAKWSAVNVRNDKRVSLHLDDKSPCRTSDVPNIPGMYGPPSACKGKAKSRWTDLRKCIRPLGGEQSLLAMMRCAACFS